MLAEVGGPHPDLVGPSLARMFMRTQDVGTVAA